MHGPVDSEDFESRWAKSLDVLLTAQVRMIRAALPFLRKAKDARIVNIASTEALGATRFISPYTAAKTGVIGLTRSLAVEFGPEGSFYSHGVSIGNCYDASGVTYLPFMGWQNLDGSNPRESPELHEPRRRRAMHRMRELSIDRSGLVVRPLRARCRIQQRRRCDARPHQPHSRRVAGSNEGVHPR